MVSRPLRPRYGDDHVPRALRAPLDNRALNLGAPDHGHAQDAPGRSSEGQERAVPLDAPLTVVHTPRETVTWSVSTSPHPRPEDERVQYEATHPAALARLRDRGVPRRDRTKARAVRGGARRREGVRLRLPALHGPDPADEHRAAPGVPGPAVRAARRLHQRRQLS